jgi:DNA ligase-1
MTSTVSTGSTVKCPQTQFAMSSPAKKRKTNKHESPDKPVRGLDFFFAKQKEAAKVKAATSPLHVEQVEELPDVGVVDSEALTDEQLARKLQEEWDREARGEASEATLSGSPSKSIKEQSPLVRNTVEETEEHQKELGEDKNATTINTVLSFGGQAKNTLSLQSAATDEDVITSNIPFDESPLTFNPSKFIPDLQKHWSTDGGRASYALLTRCFVLVNATTSRIKIVDTLVNMLRTIIEGDPESLLPAVNITILPLICCPR